MTQPDRTEIRRSADHAAKAAAGLSDPASDRALALLIAALLTPYGYGDPVLVAEWILGDKPPIDKALDAVADEVPLGDTDADLAAEWYTAAMGWKTEAQGKAATLDRVRDVIGKWPPSLKRAAEDIEIAINGGRS